MHALFLQVTRLEWQHSANPADRTLSCGADSPDTTPNTDPDPFTAEQTCPLQAQITPSGIVEVAAFDTLDGLYDCCWSEANDNVLLAACGDGSIKVTPYVQVICKKRQPPLPQVPVRQLARNRDVESCLLAAIQCLEAKD